MTKVGEGSEPSVSSPAELPAPERVLLHMPVDVRSVSLAVIAVLISLFALHWAREILIPILLGILISYAATPLVDRLERWRIPRVLGASLLIAAVAGAVAWGTWALSDQASALVDTLPEVTQKFRRLTENSEGSPSTLAKVQAAATEIESVGEPSAAAATGAPVARSATNAVAARPRSGANIKVDVPTRVVVERTRFDIRSHLLAGTLGALAFLGQVAIVFFVAIFLLASGSNFRRKMVKLAGPTLTQKKVTLETLNEITAQIQRYLLVQLAVSALLGVATWLAFYLLGMNQSAVWGVVAGVTNMIPYLGAIIVGASSAAVAMVQFGSLEMAAAVGGTSFFIHAVIGNLLTPWWMGRASRMSAFAVFVCVLLFGWLWGVAGLLLGVPILMVVKSVCDRIDDLKPIGELLGA